MGKRKLVALLNLSSWCLVMVEQLFLAVPWSCLRSVIVVFPDHTHYFFKVCRIVRLGDIFHFHRAFRKQTVETLIRRSFMWHLIWLCIVCVCPSSMTNTYMV